MIIKTAITRGRIETICKRGKTIKQFSPSDNGLDCEIYIQFDNGSLIGHTRFDNADAYIRQSLLDFENIQTSEQF